jgi:hypothetical protein
MGDAAPEAPQREGITELALELASAPLGLVVVLLLMVAGVSFAAFSPWEAEVGLAEMIIRCVSQASLR